MTPPSLQVLQYLQPSFSPAHVMMTSLSLQAVQYLQPSFSSFCKTSRFTHVRGKRAGGGWGGCGGRGRSGCVRFECGSASTLDGMPSATLRHALPSARHMQCNALRRGSSRLLRARLWADRSPFPPPRSATPRTTARHTHVHAARGAVSGDSACLETSGHPPRNGNSWSTIVM